ncbi:MAG: hypothetical protein ACQEXG_09925 [Pseudomonadota bacterium]
MPDRLHRQPIGGRIDAWLGRSGMLCDIHALPQITRRDAAQLAFGAPPLYLVMLVVRGQVRYNDCERDLTLAPGDILVEDMTQARIITTDTLNSLQLVIPQDDEDMTLPAALHGQRLPRRHPATRLLARHLIAMRDVIERLTPAAFARYQQVARALILAALSRRHSTSVRSHLHQAIREEVIRYIDAHLTDPELAAGRVATRFQMSRSQLYRLFQESGGPSAFIRYRRLCWAAQQIAGHDEHSPLDWQGLAAQLSFPSAHALKQAFRQAFDVPLERFMVMANERHDAIQEDPLPQLFQRLPVATPAGVTMDLPSKER